VIQSLSLSLSIPAIIPVARLSDEDFSATPMPAALLQ
jgi:hypothetical protein